MMDHRSCSAALPDAAQRVRSVFEHSWTAYEHVAYGADELLPLSNRSRDNWGGLAVTMIDALDTMLLMGHDAHYNRAVQWLTAHLPRRIAEGGDVPFFEVTIRALGGLLGAHTLSGNADVLRLAAQLGRALLPALASSPSGIPFCTVHLATGHASCPETDLGESIPLSELGSVQLELDRKSVV